MLAMPVHRDVPTDTVSSLLKTVAMLEANRMPYETHLQVGSSLVEVARTKLAHNFLASDKNRIFWLDSDIKWEPEAFARILALSVKHDVVGAVYPFKEEPLRFGFDFASPKFEADEFGCFSVNGLGLGFVCMRREVIEKLSERAPKLKFLDIPEPIPHVFRCDQHNGFFRGEDIAFFADIRELGFDIKIDPTITLGHVGSKTYAAKMMDYLRKES